MLSTLLKNFFEKQRQSKKKKKIERGAIKNAKQFFFLDNDDSEAIDYAPRKIGGIIVFRKGVDDRE